MWIDSALLALLAGLFFAITIFTYLVFSNTTIEKVWAMEAFQ
jgi:hypothetical protein